MSEQAFVAFAFQSLPHVYSTIAFDPGAAGSVTPRSLPYWYRLGPIVPYEISAFVIWWQL